MEKENEEVDAAYKVVRDALCMGSENIRVLERFVGLHIPQMGECACPRRVLCCGVFPL